MVKFNLKFNQTENTSILPSLKGLNITESLCEIYIMINGQVTKSINATENDKNEDNNFDEDNDDQDNDDEN